MQFHEESSSYGERELLVNQLFAESFEHLFGIHVDVGLIGAQFAGYRSHSDVRVLVLSTSPESANWAIEVGGPAWNDFLWREENASNVIEARTTLALDPGLIEKIRRHTAANASCAI